MILLRLRNEIEDFDTQDVRSYIDYLLKIQKYGDFARTRRRFHGALRSALMRRGALIAQDCLLGGSPGESGGAEP